MVAALLRFHARFGLPRSRSLSALRDWAILALATGTTESLHALMLLSLAFQRGPTLPGSLFLVSPTLMSLYHLLAKAKGLFGRQPVFKSVDRFHKFHKAVFDRKAQAVMASSRCEVLALLAFLLDPIFGGRLNILGGVMYFNFLKMRYAAPDSSEDQKAAWHWLGRRVQPVLQRVPLLQKAVDVLANQFTAAAPERAHGQ